MALQSYNWHLFIQLISWGFYYRITNVFIQDTKTCQGFVIRKLQGSLYILEKVPRSCPRVKAKPRTNSWKLRFPVDGLIGPRCKITHETNSPTQQQLPYARNDFLWFSDEKKVSTESQRTFRRIFEMDVVILGGQTVWLFVPGCCGTASKNRPRIPFRLKRTNDFPIVFHQ